MGSMGHRLMCHCEKAAFQKLQFRSKTCLYLSIVSESNWYQMLMETG